MDFEVLKELFAEIWYRLRQSNVARLQRRQVRLERRHLWCASRHANARFAAAWGPKSWLSDMLTLHRTACQLAACSLDALFRKRSSLNEMANTGRRLIELIGVEMLSDLYIATEEFEVQLRSCDRRLASWRDVKHIQRMRMADLGQDMLSFREAFVRAHINATAWVADEAEQVMGGGDPQVPPWEHIQAYLSGDTGLSAEARGAVEAHFEFGKQRVEKMVRRSKSRASSMTQDAAWELKAAYKAYFFFIRAFHDAAYGVLLTLSGATPGRYSSMRKGVENANAPGHHDLAGLPDYSNWFRAFKEMRDRIKVGVNFSLCGPQNDVGVGFNTVTPEGGLVVDASPDGNKFRLRDLITAFNYSVMVVELVHRTIPEPPAAPRSP